MIFVECKPDYSLASKLTSGRTIQHSLGKSSVLGKLVRRKGIENYENSLGIIDEDPRSNQPATLKQFTEVGNLTEQRIRIAYYKWLNNYVLILCPRLEEWIIDAARESEISMANYALPNEGDPLHEVINLNTDKFELLVDALREKSARLDKLKQCIDTVLQSRQHHRVGSIFGASINLNVHKC